jgi:hypothetical protein
MMPKAKRELQELVDIANRLGMSSAPPLLQVTVKAKTEDFEAAALEAAMRSASPLLPNGVDIEIVGCPGAHELDPNVVTYIDGVIESTCQNCGQLFRIRWVPGGTAGVQLRYLAEQILVTIDEGEEPSPVMIEALLEAHQKVMADRELIDDTLALYQTLRRVVG